MENRNTSPTEANYRDGGKFNVRIGNTTFQVGVFFNEKSQLSLDERVKNLIKKDVECGNY